MVRGIFTAASGMRAMQEELNIVSNNLANVNTDAYKRETSVLKAFPEMLARRVDDDGVTVFPLGSFDDAPIVGKLGMGVELNEMYVRYEQGSLVQTENSFDLALEGGGFFVVQTPQGERYARNGSFTISADRTLVDKAGNPVLGQHGPIQINRHNFRIDKDGAIYVNQAISADTFTSPSQNSWEQETLLDTLRVVDFPQRRYLAKQGHKLFRETEVSGAAFEMSGAQRARVHQGFVEKSNVNPVIEMTRMIEIQRLYEANQKVIQSQDEALGRAVSQVGRGVSG